MKLQMKQANMILGALGLLGGAVIIGLAYVQKLAFTKQGFPGPGFFPIMCGIAIMACSAAIILEVHQKVKKSGDSAGLAANVLNNSELRTFAVTIGLSWAAVLLSGVVGLLGALSLVVMALVRILGKESYKLSILIGIGTYIVLFLVFDMFLGVPLPMGLFKL